LTVLVGTAGWSVPREAADQFPSEGSALQRYSARFRCAEINSSFHRSHRPETWARWGNSVPEDFRFSAKLSKEITHKRKLVDCDSLLAAALEEMSALGSRLSIVLVQLPPSLAYDGELAADFFSSLRSRWKGGVACEPRHPSWFEPEAERLLSERGIARVAADPARVDAAAHPGGWPGLVYYRLHGSPVPYRSSYDDGRLEDYALAIERSAREAEEVWCIFDNTASSAAGRDALKLADLLQRPQRQRSGGARATPL
jgi:uncharacterized protein YecE (DUF72 family)